MEIILRNDVHFMQLALMEARKAARAGEIPVGAVVVCGSQAIAAGYNLREQSKDATAHAEIVAIREACQKLKRWRLEDCTIYVTLEPCPMCAGAIFNARLARLVYGAADSQAGAAGSLFNIVANSNLNHQTEVTAGVAEEECRQLLQDFFAERRQPQEDK